MKVWVILTGLLTLGVLGFAYLGWKSHTPPLLGLQDGHLRACPDSPNCVCSEHVQAGDTQHAIDAWRASEEVWSNMPELLRQQGGIIQTQNKYYIHATFQSRLFRFVDDMELRWDKQTKLIHVRSASRVGRSDLGVNRERVLRLHDAIRALKLVSD